MHDAERLRSEMKKQDISIMEMTRRSGVTRPTVQRALKGRLITFQSLEKLASPLGKHATFFLKQSSSEIDSNFPAA